MPNVASVDDVVKVLAVTSVVRANLALSVFSNAGPVTVLLSVPGKEQTYTFVADPYFRRKENYIAAGVVEAALNHPDTEAAVFVVSFANHFPVNDGPASPSYRIQVGWMEKGTLLFKEEGALPVGEVRNFHLLVTKV